MRKKVLFMFGMLVALTMSSLAGAVWENDMSTDPAGDGWVVRSGKNDYTMTNGVLRMNGSGGYSTLLDTDPFDEFMGTTKIDMVWRCTTAGTAQGAGLWCNLVNDDPVYGAVRFDATLLTNGTQTVTIINPGSSPQEIAEISGFDTGMLTLDAVVHGMEQKVDYIISDSSISVTGSVSYVQIATPATKYALTLYTTSPSAEVDYIRLEANVTPDQVYFNADPEELTLLVAESGTTVSEAIAIACDAGTNLNLTVTISDESHPGSITTTTTSPLLIPAPAETSVDIQFDRTVAGLLGGDVATGLVTLAWSEEGGGESGQVIIPINGAVAFDPGSDNIWNGEGDGTYWGDANNWILDRVPGIVAADDVFIENGSTVTVATNSTGVFTPLPQVVIRNNTAAGSALNIAADLPGFGDLLVGADAGYVGFINQSGGSVETVTMTLGSTAAPTSSVYRMTGGNLVSTLDANINATGSFEMDGGTNALKKVLTMDGSTFIQTGGSVTLSQSVAQNKPGSYLLNGSLIEVSGGTHKHTSRMQLRATSTFRIIGDAADVTLHQFDSTVQGTFDFVLNATGVSTLKNDSWGQLANCTFAVDGSAYIGGPGEIVLYDGPFHATANNALGTDYIVTGLGVEGIDWVITEEMTPRHIVVLKILGPPYEEWTASYGLFGTDADWDSDVGDSDGENNFYEYVLGGDPTNPAVKGQVPTMETGDGYVDYVHVRRVTATNEVTYELALTESLVAGPWTTNSGYTVIGYGPVVDSFDTVTNRISTLAKDEQFIKLIIDSL